MLVLSRKERESVLIGDSITLKIIEIRGSQVFIGIDAPRDVRIVRAELLKPQEVSEQL